MIHDRVDRDDRECDTIGADSKWKLEGRTWPDARRVLHERGPAQA